MLKIGEKMEKIFRFEVKEYKGSNLSKKIIKRRRVRRRALALCLIYLGVTTPVSMAFARAEIFGSQGSFVMEHVLDEESIPLFQGAERIVFEEEGNKREILLEKKEKTFLESQGLVVFNERTSLTKEEAMEIIESSSEGDFTGAFEIAKTLRAGGFPTKLIMAISEEETIWFNEVFINGEWIQINKPEHLQSYRIFEF